MKPLPPKRGDNRDRILILRPSKTGGSLIKKAICTNSLQNPEPKDPE